MDPCNANDVSSTRGAQLVRRVNGDRFFFVAIDSEARCRDTILTPLRQGYRTQVPVATVQVTPIVIADPLDCARQVPRRTRTEIEKSGVQNAHPSDAPSNPTTIKPPYRPTPSQSRR